MFLPFDTLKLAKRLEAAGLPREQAEALAEVHAEVLGEVAYSQLATKEDVGELKRAIERLEKKLDALKRA